MRKPHYSLGIFISKDDEQDATCHTQEIDLVGRGKAHYATIVVHDDNAKEIAERIVTMLNQASDDHWRGRPILCLDFDGVMHSYTSGWQGADVCNDPPVPGLFEFLADAQDHFRVVVYSSRSRQPGGIEAMRAWLERHYEAHRFPPKPGCMPPEVDLDAIEFAHEKPPAFVTIDDRAIQFDGAWPTVQELRDFKPWNKRNA